MKRSPLRRKTRMGQASRRRIQAGGVLAKGRLAATSAGWRETVNQLRARSGGRCEVRIDGYRCVRVAVDPCHIVKRSAGGSDELSNLYHGCRLHHAQEDAPYSSGRLVPRWVVDRPCFVVVTAPDKFFLR